MRFVYLHPHPRSARYGQVDPLLVQTQLAPFSGASSPAYLQAATGLQRHCQTHDGPDWTRCEGRFGWRRRLDVAGMHHSPCVVVHSPRYKVHRQPVGTVWSLLLVPLGWLWMLNGRDDGAALVSCRLDNKWDKPSTKLSGRCFLP